MNVKKSPTTFAEFTNQYSLSKTLRFELKPVGNTQKMLEDFGIIEKDEIIAQKYKITKKYFDKLHRTFVEEALFGKKIEGLDNYFELYRNWKKDKKANQKDLQNKETELRKNIVTLFNKMAKTWSQKETFKGLKNNNIEILFEEAVFKSVLKVLYGDEDESFLRDKVSGEFLLDKDGNKISVFDSWKGFTGYFTKFNETRKNFYKDDGTATAHATRIIDQNLKRFCENIIIFESIKDKLDLSEVENVFDISLVDIFSVTNYGDCFLQAGIDSYNTVLGGETLPNGEKKKGLNELINLYKQQTREKLPFFKSLDKQILSEKDKFTDEIEDAGALKEVLTVFLKNVDVKIQKFSLLITDVLNNPDAYDLSQIYLAKEALNTISRRWLVSFSTFEDALYTVLKNAKIISSSAKKTEGGYSFPEFIPLSYLKEALEKMVEDKIWKEQFYVTVEGLKNNGVIIGNKPVWQQFWEIYRFEFEQLKSRIEIDSQIGTTHPAGYSVSKTALETILKDFKEDDVAPKLAIKNLADDVLHIYQLAKYFAIEKKIEKKRRWEGDNFELDVFYTNPDFGYFETFYKNAYEDIVQVYNKLRNYLTKKPYSQEKWKLNFDNPTLAAGWDKNKEADNSAVLLKKDGKYYLGLMEKSHNRIFDKKHEALFLDNNQSENYEKVVYKFFPDQAKMFPKVCFSVKGLDFFKPSEEIYKIYKNAEFKKGDTFSIKSMQSLIKFYIDCLQKYDGWKGYNFKHIKSSNQYTNNIGDFFRDVAEDGYKITYQDVSDSYIKEKNNNGELYLFQIKNQDWNLDKAINGIKKTTTKNLHTLYFEALFSKENAEQNFPIKLNGQAEIFYRPKTSQGKLGTKLVNNKEVVNHKRYSEDKIFFHVPLTLNRTKNRTKNEAQKFNSKVNEFLVNNPNINIIGIDRGEKHLAYYSVINQQGEILSDAKGIPAIGSLNFVGQGADGKEIDYAEKLAIRASERESSRRDWLDIEKIKDLKKGYISQVVRKLADLAIEHNAIIVLEDLNMRFKQIRGGIEKSIYQQLEKALIEKLSFLVDKGETDPEKAGHLFRAYQLTAPFESFQNIGKQTGIIFYTQANYTSKTCPECGFRPNVRFDESIDWNLINIKYYDNDFTISYSLKTFTKAKETSKRSNQLFTGINKKDSFILSTKNAIRYKWFRRNISAVELSAGESKLINETGSGVTIQYQLTDCMKGLFEGNGIDIKGNINSQLRTGGHLMKFYKQLANYLYLLSNTRSSVSGTDIDIINCPCCGFDSTQGFKGVAYNGDANGAYNIGRKGLIVLDKIKNYQKNNGPLEKMNWGDIFIDIDEWDKFTQK
ncbi:hypothetical protein COZ82_03725 [Candidatus Kaiserbacteria bacterium CG_4_8_14_3_um_filter_38_9]|uniref:Type V CRISPR-associated protein Cpf1 n=1 Tax=Candidatus Kaiserbacteria bacterium CG_4_8_14_3_um_filter_38_9 TaxID=1974599 RepID=A0A2M7IMU6_9BACT|nr:MAG: hypothetical protein COZ82_03725 [Candidatus Kaiserbacteria bacterium CG_4_8_14_3_um_filter_38_9]